MSLSDQWNSRDVLYFRKKQRVGCFEFPTPKLIGAAAEKYRELCTFLYTKILQIDSTLSVKLPKASKRRSLL